jgi:hypothetical protein
MNVIEMKLNIYLKRELRELQPEFEKILGVDNLCRDYENNWEWLESRDTNSNYYLNISRPHNWKIGEYEKPIEIIIKSNLGEPLNGDLIIEKIKEGFKCDVVMVDIGE